MLFAWSDGSVISGSTVWNFSYYQNPTYFDDFPSLGIDASALYIGTNQLTVAGLFVNCRGYVFNMGSFISGFPTMTVFNLLASDVGPGPICPRGVDNYDPNNTGPSAIGYFIGNDLVTVGSFALRRITDPGGTPTLSANILIAPTITYALPVLVPHKGNTGGNSGRLNAVTDCLYAAHIRNGRLWTAHNIGVNNLGTSTGTITRNAAR